MSTQVTTPAGELADEATRLDAADPLAGCRDSFLVPPGVVYLDGNSLGPVSAAVPARLDDVVQRQWGTHLIRAWNEDDWFTAPERVGDRVGALLGAAPGQTVVGDSTSVQFFNALTAAARLRPGRTLLVTDPEHFPTNRYLAASVARLLGLQVLDVAPADLPAVLAERGAEVAAVAHGAVDYRTGELQDVAATTALAHRAGALVVWDLSHAVGALPLALDRDGVDLAVGCTYKFLSGGPGAPAFLYAAERHLPDLDLPLTGWFGADDQFAMGPAYAPAAGIGRARIGTPPLLSLLALDAALDAFDGVDLQRVRAKSLSLGRFLRACAESLVGPLGFEVVTPAEDVRRGSQVSIRHPEAHALMSALIERGVIGDVRPPDLLRFGFNALYVSHADVLAAVEALHEVAASGEHRADRHRVRRTVT